MVSGIIQRKLKKYITKNTEEIDKVWGIQQYYFDWMFKGGVYDTMLFELNEVNKPCKVLREKH